MNSGSTPISLKVFSNQARKGGAGGVAEVTSICGRRTLLHVWSKASLWQCEAKRADEAPIGRRAARGAVDTGSRSDTKKKGKAAVVIATTCREEHTEKPMTIMWLSMTMSQPLASV